MIPTETLHALIDRWRDDLRQMRKTTEADHAARTTKELCLRELEAALSAPAVAPQTAEPDDGRIEQLEARLKMEVDAHFRAATALHYAEDELHQLRLLVYEPEPCTEKAAPSAPGGEALRESHAELLAALKIDEQLQVYGYTKDAATRLGPEAVEAAATGSQRLNQWARAKRLAAIAKAEGRA